MATARPFLRPSSGEVEKIAQEEKKKWRIFRLQQVRAQSRNEAARILQDVKDEEESLKRRIKEKVRKKCEEEKENRLKMLEGKYQESLMKFGEAHRSAQDELRLMEAHERKTIENRDLALKRGTLALKKQVEQETASDQKKKKEDLLRRNVVMKEKRRAQRVASLPTPPRLKIKKRKCPPTEPKKAVFFEAGTHMTTSFVPKNIIIQKEEKTPKEPAACESAHVEKDREDEMRQEQKKKKEEDDRKRKERGEVARKRERVQQLHSNLLKELYQADSQHALSNFLHEESNDYDYSQVIKRTEIEKAAETKVEKILQDTQATHSEENASYLSKSSGIQDLSLFEFSHSEPGMMTSTRESSSSEAPQTIEFSKGSFDEKKLLAKDRHVHPKTSFDGDIHLKETVPADQAPLLEERLAAVSERINISPGSLQPWGPSPAEQATPGDVPAVESNGELEKISNPIPQYPDILSLEDNSKHIAKLLQKCKEDSLKDLKAADCGALQNAEEDTLKKIRADLKKLRLGNIKLRNLREKNFERTKQDSTFASSETDTGSVFSSPESSTLTPVSDREILEPIPGLLSSDISPSEDSCLTPVRHYIEKLKPDGSGKRPLSKRQKFEAQKRDLLHHYTQKLLNMKKEELECVSASSVEGSGIDVSSIKNWSTAGKLSTCEGTPCSSRDVLDSEGLPRSSSDSEHAKKFVGLDEYPSKLSTSDAVTTASTSTTTPSSFSSSNLCSASLSTTDDANQQKLLAILTRLNQIQKLKQYALSRQKIRGSDYNKDVDEEASKNRVEYHTKEDSYDSSSLYPRSSSSPSSLASSLKLLQGLSSEISSAELEEKICALDSVDGFSGPSDSVTSSSEGATHTGRSSTPSSLPDMIDVLKRFNRY